MMKSLNSLLLLPLLFSVSLKSQNKTLGDLNGDGEVNLLDTVLMVNHIQGTEFITNSEVLKWQADVNGDGLVNSFDVEDSLEFVFKRQPQKEMPLTSVLATSPYHGEGDIALTREFVVRFNMPLKEGTVITPEMFFATSSGELQVTSARLSSDRMKATLFLNGFRWPSNSNVTITFDGSDLVDFMDRPVDLDRDGEEGGTGIWTFSTLAVEASDPSTVVKGRVLDSDNSDGEKPLEGVIISVVGNEEQWTVLTDSNGDFRLSSAPVGRFFVVVDGRLVGGETDETLASDNWKERDYYTFVGKAWEAVPGKEVNATKYGDYNEDGSYNADPRDGNIYLPLVKKGALQTLNPDEETEVAFASGYLDEASPEQLAMLEATSITIPPGSLQSDDGTTGGSVGIAPVAPDRLPEPLPESLAMPLVITIQTDGPTNFDVPVPARFPNVDNLPPGAKSALWSFDHDTGVWEISGPMTVSEDGKYLESDPGVGIRQPGWHGSSPGAQIFGQAVITGPSVNKPKSNACGVSHANMALTENEFTSIGRLSEGIEETIFGANDDEVSFAGQILGSGSSFAKGKNLSGTSWDLFRKYVHEDAKLHSSIARTASSLLGNDEFWNAFSTTATTMRDNAVIAAIDSSKHSSITQAHLVFLQKLEQTRLSVSDQLEKWGDYSIALNGLTGPTAGISGHSVIQTDREELATAIDAALLGYRALPSGRNRLDGHLKRFAESWETFLASTLDGNLHAYKGESFVFLKRIGSEREENRTPPITAQRIRVGQGGAYDAIVRPNSWYEAWMLEPTTLIVGCTTFISPQNGGNGPVPPIPLCHDDEGDADYDYLSDRGERVAGTHKNQSDTDGDGMPDGFEILNGTDPSGGNPVFTGILATIPPTNGAFSDFVTTGNDLAILGNGPQGIDIFEIGSGVQPIKLSSFDTPGSVRKAALSQDYLAVADAEAGLTVLNVTDPEAPFLHLAIHQDSPANAITLNGNIAFVGLENGIIRSYDLFSGQKIDEVSLPTYIEDLVFHRDVLYSITNDDFWFSSFHSIPSSNGRFSDELGPFTPRESFRVPGPRQWGLKNGLGRRLFVGEDFAYVTDLMGFNRIDLTDPQLPVIAERTKTRSRGWRHTVSNGSGLALAIEHQNSPAFSLADPSVYTIKNNGKFFRSIPDREDYLENFETRFTTPGNAGAVSIYNGLAYVADGSSGLQVVNYRSYDINGVSPDLNVTLDDMEGMVEEAKFLTLRAFVFDDVQVKNVDFFVDGEKVFVDGGYPFAYTLEVPLRKDQATLRLRVVARDTGGNEAYWPGPGATDEHTLEIRDDLIAPQVVTYIPREGETVFSNDTVMTIFNERMDPESIHVRSVRLYEVNGDALTAVELDSVQYDDATQTAYAQLPSGIKPATYKLLANEMATDLAGNPLEAPTPERTLHGPGELKGKLWFDLNHNTVQDDDEETLSDWTVYLDYNNNGERDPGEPNASTDKSGNYIFSGLLPGGYAIAEEVPFGWVQTFPRNQSLGTEEVFTNTGWIYEGDNHGGSALAVDTLGNGWTAGIVPEGNFSIGTTFFDGNDTAGILYLARISPTGQVDRVETLGSPDGNNTDIPTNLLLKPDHDGGIWLSGSYHGDQLVINGERLNSNNTDSSFLARFDQDFNATFLNSFSGVSISSLSPDLDGRLAIAGTLTGGATLDEHSLTTAGYADAFLAKLASTGAMLWASTLGGDANETAESVHIDSTGNTWIAGDSGSANFTASSNGLDLSGDAGGYLALYDPAGENLWAIDPVGGLSVTDDSSGAWFLDQNGSNEIIKFVDTNGTVQASFVVSGASVGISGMQSQNLIATEDGNALVCLNTPSGFITINGETIMSGVDNQATLAKLKTNGQVAWSLPITTGSNFLWSLARGSDEFVWALGSVSGEGTLALGDFSLSLSGATGFLLKVDPTGEVAGLWSTTPASEVQVDPNDNVWITGAYQGDAGQEHTITIGQLSLTGNSANSRFLGRIGKAGTDFHSVQLAPGTILSDLNFGNSLPLIETRTAMCIGGPDEDASRSVVTDPAGNGYYAGDFTGYTEFGGKRLESDGQNDAMFVKFLPGGKIAWAQNFGGDGDDLGHAIFADDNGSLFATGTFQGTAQFGDFELVSAGMRDIFVLRLDDNGSPLWAFRAGGPQDDDALTLVSDSNNSVYVGGSIQETADFGSFHLRSQGSQDAYLLKLDYNGSVQWVASLMSQDRSEIRTLTLDQNKLPVVAGDFAGTLQLRGTGDADDGIDYLTLVDSVDSTDSNETSNPGESDQNSTQPDDSNATPTEPAFDPSNGLLAYYPFDGNANDATGNGFDGNASSGASLIPDRHGDADSAYHFDGSGAHIELNNPEGLAKQIASVSFWVRADDDNSHSILSLSHDANASTNTDISIGNNRTGSLENEMVTYVRYNDAKHADYWSDVALYNINGYVNTDRSSLFDYDWHHVALTFNGEENGSRVYIDGISLPTTQGTFNVHPKLDPGKFAGLNPVDFASIGSRKENGGFFSDTNGSIDDLRIYDRALSAEEVEALYIIESPVEEEEVSSENQTITESWTFTNAGAEGRFGPSQEQVNTAYTGTNLDGKVTMHVMDGNVTGIQEWIVPKNGIYKIEATAPNGQSIFPEFAGKGAIISGEFELKSGEVIRILVGQQGKTVWGSSSNAIEWHGGSGGTFVVKNPFNSTEGILVIAGGGAGDRSQNTSNHDITDASLTTTGKNASSFSTDWGMGGTNGSGGQRGYSSSGVHTPGGGAGFAGNGQGSSDTRYSLPIEAQSFVNGGVGGFFMGDSNTIINGGFGGGGSGGWGGAGGAGGFSGGGGDPNGGWAGGGSSFNSGINQVNGLRLTNSPSHGKVIISLLGNPKLESAGQTDIFVARLDANGEVLEATQGSGTGIDSVNGIALGKYGEFYLTGVYGPAFQLGETNASGDSLIVNAFHTQLDNNLSTQWISTLGGGGFNRGESVAVDTKGRAYFVGSYTGTAHFEEKSLTARGGSDAYLVEYDYRGNVLRLISHGGESGDAGTAIALDNDGGIIMTGTYRQEAHIFDGEHICHEHGGTDVFVARYDYGIQEPETHFVVEVVEDDNGTEVILINDEPAPKLELIPGLEYTFEIEENASEEHPFVIVEEGDGGSDLWEVEEDVNKTENLVIIKIDEDTPIDLGYGSETEEGLGGEIEVKQDPKPSYRLIITEYDDGSNNVDGADIRVFKNGQEVSLDEPFEEGTRLRVQLDPSDEFIFEGWQGDLPADANRSFSQDRTFVVTMDQDRTLKAYFSTPAPDDPRDFLDTFDIKVAAQQADEFGRPITGADGPSYTLRFAAYPDGMQEDGSWGYMTVIPSGNFPDFDEDGQADTVVALFTFEQIDETSGSFQAIQPYATLSGSGETVEVWGGGMELSFTYQKPNGKKEAGAYVILKNDGSTEQGDWDSDQIREDFSLNDN